MLSALVAVFYASCAAGAFVGLVRVAPRHRPELYALPVAGTVAFILTLAALGASLYR
ncbi:hypothetical protein ACIQPP_05480 [Streptomyces violaceusniger]|uniref:hypothetical protein n=1 Tax=Streptomyces violaceusniger TaxID=68280 RepID=UPI0009C23EE1|nr:hypothetical protein [Streptomyces hygroscopicus]AQW55272.1 hypothetical protein SHXM_08735 [Streptomyces hygroscopicus]